MIIVAEGAGQDLIQGERQKDASGNLLNNNIGMFLKDRIKEYFKRNNFEVNIKYFDPTYLIRGIAAEASDSVFCLLLAQNAVHAAMAGRTNCVVGNIGDWYTLVPIPLATIERQKVNLSSDLWRSVMDATGQEFYFNSAAHASHGAVGAQMVP